MLKNFDDLIKKVQNKNSIKKLAVVGANDLHSLEAVFEAKDKKIIEPVLIGDREKIKKVLEELNRDIKDLKVVDESDEIMMAKKAVQLVHAKEADFIMKGKIQTGDLLKAVVDRENGLRVEGAAMSHISINEVPTYHKLLAVTDGGMVTYPDLPMKRKIIENAVAVFNALGYEKPKVAVLAAIEKVNPKMPETIDAKDLKNMNISGELKNCILDGPISYDLSMSKEVSRIKGFESEVAGDVDILVVPNITAGNILGKSLIFSAGARMAGFVVGAQVPIVLTSRGASAEEKFLSIVLSAGI